MMVVPIPGIDETLPRLTSLDKKPLGLDHNQTDGVPGVKFENWAQTFTCKPDLYFKPRNVEEIQKVSTMRRVALV